MADLFEGSGHVPPRRAVFPLHPSDDELELYSMGRAPEPESIGMEEHILVCARCQDRLREADEFVALMKETTKEIARREGDALSGPAERHGVFWLRPLASLPGPAFAAMAAVVVLTVGVAIYQMERPQPGGSGEVAVDLVASRGVEAPSISASHAPSVRLSMDTAGLPGGRLDVTLVSEQGSPVWMGSAQSENNRATAVVSKNLRAGHYFARISANFVLLREFAFEVR